MTLTSSSSSMGNRSLRESFAPGDLAGVGVCVRVLGRGGGRGEER